MILKFIGKLFVLVAACLFVGSVTWWYLFYEQFLGHDVKQASECFYYTTEICSLSDIIGIAGNVPTYSPLPLWCSIASFVIGIILIGFSSPLRH